MRPTTPTTRMPAIALAVLALAGLAGCNDFNRLTSEADLSYDGAESGNHSDTADCDADGHIRGNGEITDGEVVVRVTDGGDTQLFQRSFDGSFDLDRTRLDGDSGTWTLRATRSGDDIFGDQFRGEYAFFLDC